MQRFQRLEPLHEHVKIIVGYLRLVVDIVKSAVMPYLAAQLVYLGRGEIKSALHPALRIHAVVRRTACLAESVAQDL